MGGAGGERGRGFRVMGGFRVLGRGGSGQRRFLKRLHLDAGESGLPEQGR